MNNKVPFRQRKSELSFVESVTMVGLSSVQKIIFISLFICIHFNYTLSLVSFSTCQFIRVLLKVHILKSMAFKCKPNVTKGIDHVF